MAYKLTQQLESGIYNKGLINSSEIDDVALSRTLELLNNLFNQGKRIVGNQEVQAYTGGSSISVDQNNKINVNTVSAKPTDLSSYAVGAVIIVCGSLSDDGVYVVQEENNSKHLYLFAQDNTELNTALAQTIAITGSDKILDFSESKNYSAGDLCYYNIGGTKYLWRFLDAKGPGAWNGNIASQTTFYDEIRPIRANETVDLTFIKPSTASFKGVTITIGSEQPVFYSINSNGKIVTPPTLPLDATAELILDAIDAQPEVTLTVPKGTSYIIAPDDIDDCGPIVPRTYTALLNSRSITFEYYPSGFNGGRVTTEEALTVQIKGISGSKSGIAIGISNLTNGTATTLSTNEDGVATTTIPINTSYTITPAVIGGYSAPTTRTLIANGANRTIYVYYISRDKDCVFLDSSFNEVAVDQLDSSVNYNTVAYICFQPTYLTSVTSTGEYHLNSTCAFMIRIADITNPLTTLPMCSVDKEFTTLLYPNNGIQNDKDGAWNTDKIITDATSSNNLTVGDQPAPDTSAAANYAKGLTITVGYNEQNNPIYNRGYIGAYGQWKAILENKDKLDGFWQKLAGNDGLYFPVFTNHWWTSTQYSSTEMVGVYRGVQSQMLKTSKTIAVLPFFDVFGSGSALNENSNLSEN